MEEIKEEKPKTKKTPLIIIGVLLAISVIGLTYAYFTANNVEGNSTTNTIVTLTADYGKVIVSYENGNRINATTVNLTKANGGTNNYYMLKFQIEKTGDLAEDIEIRWKDLVNDFCQYKNSSNVCTNTSTDTDVRDELTYSLYNCTLEQYNAVTTSDDADITSCTKISAATDAPVPVSDSVEKLHTASKITIEAGAKKYYIVRVALKNINGNQNYNMGKTFTGTINVTLYVPPRLLTDEILAAHPPVSDAASSTYVTSATGVDFSQINSPTNGQGLYINNKNSQGGTTKYFRGGNYCYLNSAAISTESICTTAGGTWTDYHCSLSDSKSACETAGGTYYELKNNVMFGGYAWKIIRINDDGSIRMIYNGVSPTIRGINAQIGTTYYNTSTAGDTGSGPYNSATEESIAKEYASYDNGNIESTINTWYTNNLLSESEYINDENYCSDTAWGINEEFEWYFVPYTRINTNRIPVFSCSNTETYNVTNGKLASPIATITADEVAYAGAIGYTANYTYYLQTGVEYWTMSPYRWNMSGGILIAKIEYDGAPITKRADEEAGARPVINLKPDVTISGGSGTLTDPWTVS